MPAYFRRQPLSVLLYQQEVDGLVVVEVSIMLATAWKHLMDPEGPAYLTEAPYMAYRAAENRALAGRSKPCN